MTTFDERNMATRGMELTFKPVHFHLPSPRFWLWLSLFLVSLIYCNAWHCQCWTSRSTGGVSQDGQSRCGTNTSLFFSASALHSS